MSGFHAYIRERDDAGTFPRSRVPATNHPESSPDPLATIARLAAELTPTTLEAFWSAAKGNREGDSE